MNKNNPKGFNGWSIEKGDYKRDDTSTWSYQRKLILKRRIKYALLTIVYVATVAVVSYLIFS
ncbi:MAG: hypothetical protein AB1521_01855 [Bacteroidota bacterium]